LAWLCPDASESLSSGLWIARPVPNSPPARGGRGGGESFHIPLSVAQVFSVGVGGRIPPALAGLGGGVLLGVLGGRLKKRRKMTPTPSPTPNGSKRKPYPTVPKKGDGYPTPKARKSAHLKKGHAPTYPDAQACYQPNISRRPPAPVGLARTASNSERLRLPRCIRCNAKKGQRVSRCHPKKGR